MVKRGKSKQMNKKFISSNTKRAWKKKNNSNLIKWIIAILLILVALLICYKIFTGQIISTPPTVKIPTIRLPSPPIYVPNTPASNLTALLGGNWTSTITLHAGTNEYEPNGDIFNLSCAGGLYSGINITIQLIKTLNQTQDSGGVYIPGYSYGIYLDNFNTKIPLPSYYTDTIWKSDGTATMPIINFLNSFNLTIKMIGNYHNSSWQRPVTISSNGSCSFLCISGTCIKTCKTCSQLGIQCGSVDDGCGSKLNCGICINGNCVNGKCTSCKLSTQSCSSNSDCCSGLICFTGKCTSCMTRGTSCGGTDSYCCSGKCNYYPNWVAQLFHDASLCLINILLKLI